MKVSDDFRTLLQSKRQRATEAFMGEHELAKSTTRDAVEKMQAPAS